jgi:hypothetical protein
MKALGVMLAALAGTVSLAGSAAALPVQALSISDAQVAEGAFGTRSLTFRVTLSESSQSPVTVGYRTQNETARAGEDYDFTEGTLQFGPGETTKTFEVPVRGDRKVEPDEFFSAILFAPSGGAHVAEPGGVGTGTVRNDDVAATRCACKSVKLRLAGMKTHAMFREVVVKAAMTCRTGDVADCAGFVKTVSSSATQKPTPFTCRARKCSSFNTYTLKVRVGVTRAKLRLRSGCRGERGELRTFTLALPK